VNAHQEPLRNRVERRLGELREQFPEEDQAALVTRAWLDLVGPGPVSPSTTRSSRPRPAMAAKSGRKCDICEALPGEFCRRKNGKPRAHFHKGR